MATFFRIDTERGVIFTTCRDRVNDSEVLSYLRSVPQHPNYSPVFRHLVDCTQVASFDVSAELTRSVAQKKLFSSRSQCAIVAPQDHIYGMARMFELQHGGSIHVFRDLASAEKWLGLDSPAYAPSPRQTDDVAARARYG
ncbi:MAG TPA: hypothetical protein VG649_06755 [Candidatus Angelobacter sp.]|jgi:hypothetical protein|nr:hypothetical protein [Candidatus Angelobacter sp.]